MLTFPILLLVIAFVCFVFEAIRGRSVLAAGFACWVLAELLGLRAIR